MEAACRAPLPFLSGKNKNGKAMSGTDMWALHCSEMVHFATCFGGLGAAGGSNWKKVDNDENERR